MDKEKGTIGRAALFLVCASDNGLKRLFKRLTGRRQVVAYRKDVLRGNEGYSAGAPTLEEMKSALPIITRRVCVSGIDPLFGYVIETAYGGGDFTEVPEEELGKRMKRKKALRFFDDLDILMPKIG